MSSDRALAIDLGGTRVRAALVDRTGKVSFRKSRPTPAQEGAEAVVAAIAATCRSVLDEAACSSEVPVGACAAGPIDSASGIAFATSTIKGFNNFPFRRALEDALGLTVSIENDGQGAALGEWRFGAGRNSDNFAFVTISTGIGGGFVVDGHLVHGRLGLAADIGHLPVKPGGAICFCGQPGCWEAEASGSALQKKAVAVGFASLEDAFDRARKQDEGARIFVDDASGEIAIGLVALTHLLSPERIVIGGGVSNAFDLLGPLLLQRVRERVLPPYRDVAIVRSELGDDAGLIGAAVLAFETEDLSLV